MDVPPEPHKPSPEPPDLAELVERRGALRVRMAELRASDPEDHEGFLRTVDQLLAVSNQIIDRLDGTAERAASSGPAERAAASSGPAERAAAAGPAEPASGGQAGGDRTEGSGGIERRAEE